MFCRRFQLRLRLFLFKKSAHHIETMIETSLRCLVKQLVLSLVATTLCAPALAGSATPWYGTAWEHVKDTWRYGDTELYVPFWTYHPPFAYDADLRREYNEFPAGLGLGKGRYNASGNWEGIYAMTFMDSHNKPSYMVGYGWMPTWEIGQSDVKVGLGLTGFLMSRQNYVGGIPFPGILPMGSLSYGNLSVQAAYTPGLRKNQGNVLFMWGKWTFR
jgi:palmitoyl transferase